MPPTATTERTPVVLDDRFHAAGCPATRVETHRATRPAKPDQGVAAVPITITRCVECGGQTEEVA